MFETRENLNIKHISTTDMVADMLTKGLPKGKHLECLEKAEYIHHTASSFSERESRGSVG